MVFLLMSTPKEKRNNTKKKRLKNAAHFLGLFFIFALAITLGIFHSKFAPARSDPSAYQRMTEFREDERSRIYSDNYLRFEHKAEDGRHIKAGWSVIKRNDTILIEAIMTNRGQLTISDARVTVYFMKRNLEIQSAPSYIIIGNGSDASSLIPFHSINVKLSIPIPPGCDNDEPMPVLTHLSFAGLN